MKRFDKAISDFDIAIRLNNSCGLGNDFDLMILIPSQLTMRFYKLNKFNSFFKILLGYMGKADCLRFMGEFEKAIHLYTQALEKEEIIAKVAVLKRAITFLEAK